MTSSSRLSGDDVLNRVNTGIQAFDDLVVGGLPRGRATVVAGSPDSGKTVFAMQFLAHGITDNAEPGVFVTFDEPWAEIAGNTGKLRLGY
jgi:circadian clock protein KaiC